MKNLLSVANPRKAHLILKKLRCCCQILRSSVAKFTDKQSNVVHNLQEATMTIIGIDPHPGSHTAAALDTNGKVLEHKTVNNDKKGLKSLKKWLKRYEIEVCGIEGANNPFARELSKSLSEESYPIVNVHPSYTSQYRSKRGMNKTDEVDAENVARAIMANPKLRAIEFKSLASVEDLKQLSRVRAKLVEQRKALRLSLTTITEQQTSKVLDTVIASLTAEIKKLEVAMKIIINNLMPELLTLKGISIVHASVLLAEVGDPRSFRSQHAFAIFAGCAPIQRSSGVNIRYQVNTGGNRILNSLFHMMIQIRLRCCEQTKIYIDKKVKEGKTKRSAFRCLKTHIARQVFRFMLNNTNQHPERWISS